MRLSKEDNLVCLPRMFYIWPPKGPLFTINLNRSHTVTGELGQDDSMCSSSRTTISPFLYSKNHLPKNEAV